MNKCQIAEYFDVSRPTVNDWKRRGAPITEKGGDPAEVAAWKARRDLELAGAGDDPAFRDIPDLTAEMTRRRLDLDKRVEMVNAMPVDAKCAPGVIKAALCGLLILEGAVLALSGKIISDPTPETLPARLLRAVLDAVNLEKDISQEDDLPSPSPAGHRARKAGKAAEVVR